jgi:hypothetical protein
MNVLNLNVYMVVQYIMCANYTIVISVVLIILIFASCFKAQSNLRRLKWVIVD